MQEAGYELTKVSIFNNKMVKRILGITGIIILLFGIYLFNKINQEDKSASSKDNSKTSYGIITGPLPCKWEVNLPERVMSEDKSQAIVIKITNAADERCESVISFRSPGFDVSPVKEEQSISLNKDTDGSLSWIITPKKSGTYEIAVSDALNTKIFGISVTNIFGLNSIQAKIASIFGSLFGPMLTLPWWWDRLKRKKDDQKDNSQIDSNRV